MGVVNANPDSFYSYQAQDKNAFALAIEDLIQKGASIIDVGAESTSPYSQPITYKEEIDRLNKTLIPYLDEEGWPLEITLSLDSYHIESVTYLLEWIEKKHLKIPFIWNDIAGELENEILVILKHFPTIQYIYCHNFATPRERASQHMSFARTELTGEELLAMMTNSFKKAFSFFAENQMQPRIIFDPAFAFSKTREQNHYFCQHFIEWVKLFPTNQQWLLGISRKSFLRDLRDLKSKDPALLLSIDQIQSALLTRWLFDLPLTPFILRVHDPLVVKSVISCLNILGVH